MDICLFGSLAVRDGERRLAPGDFGGIKPKQLLEVLLLARGRLQSKDQLADALWPVRPPRDVSATLDTYVCVLRRRLSGRVGGGRDLVVREDRGYRVPTAVATTDLDEFDRLTLESEHVGPDRRRDLLEAALALAVGDLLEDEPYADWVLDERDRYRDRVARANHQLARDDLARRDWPAAVRHGEALLSITPTSEVGMRTVALANHALGLDEIAQRTFARWERQWRHDLGVPPSAAALAFIGALATLPVPRDQTTVDPDRGPAADLPLYAISPPTR